MQQYCKQTQGNYHQQPDHWLPPNVVYNVYLLHGFMLDLIILQNIHQSGQPISGFIACLLGFVMCI